MSLVCPECGCTGDPAAFAADGAYKSAMVEQAKLPKVVEELLAPYLGLFRPPKRSLTGPRTLRLVRELVELVATGTVQVDREASRPCPPRLWAEGMRQMVERKGGLKSHFENHNYLRKVVYDLANAADAGRETRENKAVAQHRAASPEPSPEDREPRAGQGWPDCRGAGEPLTPEARANRDAFFERVKELSGKMSMP